MTLNTTRFGELEIESDAIITFTQPIIGFQEYRRFVVLPGPDGSLVTWLQSIDSGELAFLMVDPRHVFPGYQVSLSQHELSELAVTGVGELEIYTLVVVPEDPSKIRTNLKAPVLINRKHRLGKQTVLEKSDYPIQCFLAQAKPGAHEPQEVSNARSDA